ncbi:MAG: uracil-DNA glycosylase [Actinomycetota bacterium]|nr:uracil-DNA glycosylase [Actinomycetota bacterium]
MSVAPAPLAELIDPTWAAALAAEEPTIRALGTFLREELAAGRGYQPAGAAVLRAFALPLPDVKVLIVGQDPYPTPGQAVGLSFAVPPDLTTPPRSLVNIASELRADLGCLPPRDLARWADEGVLLLNRVLTVRPGVPGSHRGKGWERVTDAAVAALAGRGGPLVAILWGRDAQSLTPRLAGVPIIASAHPSPLSANRGFFGSRPFSRANQALVDQGGTPVRWCEPQVFSGAPGREA